MGGGPKRPDYAPRSLSAHASISPWQTSGGERVRGWWSRDGCESVTIAVNRFPYREEWIMSLVCVSDLRFAALGVRTRHISSSSYLIAVSLLIINDLWDIQQNDEALKLFSRGKTDVYCIYSLRRNLTYFFVHLQSKSGMFYYHLHSADKQCH